jgi:hypothetical protein
MPKVIALMAALLPMIGAADTEQRFAQLRDNAEPLASVASFVDRYVGDCVSAMLGGGDCSRNTEAFRRAANGKKYYLIVTEGTANVLQLGEVDIRSGRFVLNLTPFFSGSSSAVTHGAPSKLDANGNVVLPFIRIDSVLPDGWSPAMMARQVQAQSLRIQVVFTVLDLWTLPKRGGGKVRGVKARFDGIVVTDGRTGTQIGTWYAR